MLMLQRDGDINEDVSRRIKVGWMKWHEASSILEMHMLRWIGGQTTKDRVRNYYICDRVGVTSSREAAAMEVGLPSCF